MNPKKCDKELIERVRPMVESGDTWPKIAKVVDLSVSTLLNYRSKGSYSYSEEFALMVEESLEIAGNKTKAGQIVQSVKHNLKHVTRELQVIACPKRPSSNYTKEQILLYCDEKLELQFHPTYPVKDMWYHIDRRIEELIEWGAPYYIEEMVIVRDDNQEVDPSAQAVKNVLTNTGDKEKRWNLEDKHEIDASDPLKQLLEQIGGIKKGLPETEDIG